jgi:c-di-AMP phosphodiesterase-like protein
MSPILYMFIKIATGIILINYPVLIVISMIILMICLDFELYDYMDQSYYQVITNPLDKILEAISS